MRAKRSTTFKILAGIFAVLFLLCAVGSAALWGMAQEAEFGTSTYAYIENDVRRYLVEAHLRDVFQTFHRGDDAAAVYADTNLIFRIEDEEGHVLAESTAKLRPGSSFEYTLHCQEDIWREPVFPEETGETVNTQVPRDPELYAVETTVTVSMDTTMHPDDMDPEWITVRYTLRGAVDPMMEQKDRYSVLLPMLECYYEIHGFLLPLAIGFLLLWLMMTVWLMSAAGHHRGEEEPRCGWLEYVPFDLLTFGVMLWIALHDVAFHGVGDPEMAVGVSLFVLADAVLLLLWLMTLAVRLKTKSFLKTTLVWYVLVLAWRILSWLGRTIRRIGSVTFRALGIAFGSIPLVWKTALCVLILALTDLLAALYTLLDAEVIFIYLILKNIVIGTGILFCAVLMRRIQAGGERLASGDLDTKIDTGNMFGDFRQFAENMNRLGDGMSAAVEERMKSERFRTELITNVSHDIKTPLTSIVNYVDLMGKENVTEEPLAGYIEVLSRQSARLKKLTEDLIEASKAATGAIAVHPEALDVTVLLGQTAGEYDEKLRSAGLDLILHQPGEPVMILADGRLLWRVFDNLMNNIVKYALPGTRVYLTLNVGTDEAEILFRNITRDELHVEGEELLNRFTRGDASRSTEGSGLGLSIAKSLTELQGGTLSLSVDGDLFKVVLRLPLETE